MKHPIVRFALFFLGLPALSAQQLQLSPKYLIGESYGTRKPCPPNCRPANWKNCCRKWKNTPSTN